MRTAAENEARWSPGFLKNAISIRLIGVKQIAIAGPAFAVICLGRFHVAVHPR